MNKDRIKTHTCTTKSNKTKKLKRREYNEN